MTESKYPLRPDEDPPPALHSKLSEDCFACKMTSFIGLAGAGAYVGYHANRQKGKGQMALLTLVSSGLIYLGLARVLGLRPFSDSSRRINNALKYKQDQS